MKTPHQTPRTGLVLVLGFLVCQAVLAGQTVTKETPVFRAEAGVLDLRNWDWKQPIPLAGEWRFSWKKLLDPTCQPASNIGFIELPSPWTGHEHQGNVLPASGYATYCLTVLLGPRATPIVIEFPRVRTASSLWINGTLLANTGEVGTDQESSRPLRIDRFLTIAPAKELNIVLQVSNFHFRSGGADKPLVLADSLRDLDPLASAQESVAAAFFVGAFLVLGLYHLVVRSFWRRSEAPIMFGLLCLVMAGYQLSRANNLFSALFPISWASALRLEYTLFACTIPLAAAFLRALYPQEAPLALPRLSLLVASVFALLVWTQPTQFSSQWLLPVFQLCFLGIGIWGLSYMALAIRRKRPGAYWFLIGSGLWILSGLGDGLVSRMNPTAPKLLPFGFMGLIVAQAILLAIAQSQSHARTKDLSSRLLTLASERLALEQAAYSDPLTGLDNRRRLDESGPIIHERIAQDGDDSNSKDPQWISLLYIDVDDFKSINDQFGHEVGDEVLVRVANVIREEVRPYDLSVRLGGDEFVVLSPDLGEAEVRRVANRLRNRLKAPLTVAGCKLNISASIGIATLPALGFDLGTLLRRADSDMYEQKNMRST